MKFIFHFLELEITGLYLNRILRSLLMQFFISNLFRFPSNTAALNVCLERLPKGFCRFEANLGHASWRLIARRDPFSYYSARRG